MPPPAILQLSDVGLGQGGAPLFDGLTLAVHPGDRIALVGRNGAGKSTLLRVMAGLVEPDRGRRAAASGLRIGHLEQDPDMSGHATLGAWAAAGLPAEEAWQVAAAAEGLGFRPEAPVATASGGERRRAALARALAGGPDLLLLDEPTNHLDIAAIRWLEARLAVTSAAVVLVSHDRAFLRALSRSLLWLDRGEVRRLDRGFEAFETWRDEVWAAEEARARKLDRRLRAEARWAVEGISARRRRNQGRLRALADLRAERAAMIRRQGTAALSLEGGPGSGQLVIAAKGLSKSFGGRPIVRGLDLTVMRGDRVAVIGPNGAGKTTLLGLLLGRIPPDAGAVRHGTGLVVAEFDQARGGVDPRATLWEALTGDPAARVPGRADQVMVRGTPRHVVAYLRDFLFDEAQARAPVASLSGGERARLLLARITARPANLLVLDEPTNDLDVETLDLLQEQLADYPGTVLLVSHDRDFLDRVATLTVAMEGDGRATVYAGGWSDYLAQRGSDPFVPPPAAPPRPAARAAAPAPAPQRPRRGPTLSFTERHRLDTLPAEIARLEAEIARLAELLAQPGIHAADPRKAARAADLLAERQARLAAAEAEWLALAERAEAAGG
jgi:ATP-binding cassette subfamily F protein uup